MNTEDFKSLILLRIRGTGNQGSFKELFLASHLVVDYNWYFHFENKISRLGKLQFSDISKWQSSQLARFSTYKTKLQNKQYHFKAPQIESHDV